MISRKVLFILAILTSILIGFLFYNIYSIGKEKGKSDCLKTEVKIKTETIEVIKYITKKESEIYSRPSSSFKSLLERMERNEL